MSQKHEALASRELVLKAIEIRAFEEAMLKVFGNGKARGTFHTSKGQELISCILTSNLDPEDFIFGTHRSHALYLSISNNFSGLAAEVLGKQDASSHGIGGSQHLQFQKLYTNGVQGGMTPIAVGASTNSKSMAVCVIGDGTLGEGIVYESLNLSKVLRSKTLFLIEDNGIAQSTKTQTVQSGNVAEKFTSFGLTYLSCDANEIDKLTDAISNAVAMVKLHNKPMVLHIFTHRLGPHSKGDDNRSELEINEILNLDVVSNFIRDESAMNDFYIKKKDEFDELIKKISNRESADAITINFVEEMVAQKIFNLSKFEEQSKTIRDLTYKALEIALSTDSNTQILGEDIVQKTPDTPVKYNGAFGVTKDLSEKFPAQVKNMPISEAAIVGVSIGLALQNKPTICEIMFGDFTTLIVDQIYQQASKLPSIYGKKINLPVLVRTPMGGRRGYGPTHSQNLEGLFFGLPNVLVYSQNHYFNPNHYKELLEQKFPVIVIEHKDLYTISERPVLDRFYNKTFCDNNDIILRSKVKRATITIITYGYAAYLVELSAISLIVEHEIFVNIVIPQTISPLNMDFATELLEQSEIVFLVEESDSARGASGLVLKEFQRLGLDKSFMVLGGEGMIGASVSSETHALISVDKIVNFVISKAKVGQ